VPNKPVDSPLIDWARGDDNLASVVGVDVRGGPAVGPQQEEHAVGVKVRLVLEHPCPPHLLGSGVHSGSVERGCLPAPGEGVHEWCGCN
jgi:hypothetical protein